MTVRKRGGHWHYDFQIRGQRYRQAIPTARTKEQAKRAEDSAREDIHNGVYKPAHQQITFRKFTTEVYLPWGRTHTPRSMRGNEPRAQMLINYFGAKELGEINSFSIEQFKRNRIETPTKRGGRRSGTTINHELTVLSRILSLAVEQGFLKENPCKKVKRLRFSKSRNRVMTREEESRLTEHAPSSVQWFITMAINTGMRHGEIANLNWSSVDFEKGNLYITETKTNEDRTIPINAAVRALLLERQTARKPDQMEVFRGYHSRRLKEVNVVFRMIVKRLGIPNLTFHDMRHTAASRMLEAGVDPFTIAEILGHKKLAMTTRYTHASDGARRQAVESLSQKECHNIVALADYRKAG